MGPTRDWIGDASARLIQLSFQGLSCEYFPKMVCCCENLPNACLRRAAFAFCRSEESKAPQKKVDIFDLLIENLLFCH